MTEEKIKAHNILHDLGKIDGQKHIKQVLYLVEDIGSNDLSIYWKNVEKEFNYAINNHTPY